jgi:hypothetical protein
LLEHLFELQAEQTNEQMAEQTACLFQTRTAENLKQSRRPVGALMWQLRAGAIAQNRPENTQ